MWPRGVLESGCGRGACLKPAVSPVLAPVTERIASASAPRSVAEVRSPVAAAAVPRVGHDRQCPVGLPGGLLEGVNGEQCFYEADDEGVPRLIPGGHLLQFPPQ
jgi:hypothetical protein